MRTYRTPLPRVFAGLLEAGLNRALALDPKSAKRLLVLQDKCLQLDIEDLDITLYLAFDSGHATVSLDFDREPDTVISGTPAALFGMAARDAAGAWGLPGSDVRIAGNANLARDIERMFSQLEPDWQTPASGLIGEVAAFQLTTGIGQGVEALRRAAGNGAEMAATYFRDETGELVGRAELAGFSEAVDTLSDAADRLQARLEALAEKQQ